MSEDKQIKLNKLETEDDLAEASDFHPHIRQLGLKVPSEWIEISLGEIGELDTSSVDKKSNDEEESVNLVNYMDVYDNYIIDSSIEYMVVTAPKSQIKRSQVEPGDILFTPSSEEPGDIGNSAVVTEKLENTLHSYHTVRLRPTSDATQLDIGFSGWLANAPYVAKQFTRRATGSTRYTLTLSDFSNTRVLIPPLEEQRKIASVLYTVDQAIQQTEEIIEVAERIRLGVKQDIFSTGYFAHEEYQESQIGTIPRTWEIKSADEVCDEIIVGVVTGATDHYVDADSDGVPFIRSQDVHETYIEQDDLRYISRKFHEQQASSELYEGDVITVRTGEPGTSCVVPPELERSNCFSLIISRPKDETNECFYSYYVNSPKALDFIDSWKAGGVQDNFNIGVMERLPIPIPPEEEQAKIVELLDIINRKIDSERRYQVRLNQIKQGLMQDLLSGEVRTPDKNIEIVDEVLAHG